MRVKLEIGQYQNQNYSSVYEIWKMCNLSLGSSDTREQIDRFAQMNSQYFLIAKIDGKIIGTVMGAFDGRRGYVHHLAVHPDLQRRGIGSELMKELHQRFLASGVQKVHLFVENSNSKVIAFYKSLGWFVRSDLQMMSYIPNSPQEN